MKVISVIFLCIIIHTQSFAQNGSMYHEQYRPQIHFSPKAHWMNDPNGMVYNDGIYHLFYQYCPGSTVWGPMHWGHAVSTDLVHWKEQPIALYPDSIGYIFSGSAVVDKNNTSGFGKNGNAPLVAVFTQHDPVGEKQNTDVFQNQSIAFSNDNGKTWIKYKGNPVIKNPGIKDFRDPKVMWYDEGKKWILVMAVKDHVSLFSSLNLKDWTKESDFGEHFGAHGGVWECPDIFYMNYKGKKVWVITCSINPGAPNGGSGTQYFVGDFDGKNFTTTDTITKWIDYGPDDYAGVTWSNTGDKKIFLGWMSNWSYAIDVPTIKWRSATTLPRELKLKHINDKIFIASKPLPALSKNELKPVILNDAEINRNFDLLSKTGRIKFPCRIKMNLKKPEDFTVVLSNDAKEKVLIGYNKNENRYFIDRTNSEKTDFQKDFAGKHFAPRLTTADSMNLDLIIDESSVELFADNGISVMTEIFFPSKPYNKINIEAPEKIAVKRIEYALLKSIWPL